MFRTPASLFRVLAIAEVITWAILITALVLRAAGVNPVVATVGGGIHGFVFLSYGATAILVALNQRWRVPTALLAIVSAIVPFATVPVEIWLSKRGKLAGEWRLEESTDPRDRTWYDRALRFFLRKPWVLALLILTAIVLLYVVLLTVGPPGGSH